MLSIPTLPPSHHLLLIPLISLAVIPNKKTSFPTRLGIQTPTTLQWGEKGASAI
jgi:hypothetical protein